MGFLESLRKKREEEEFERKRALIEEEYNKIQTRHQEEKEKKRLEALEEEAEKRFQKSGLLAIITEVSELGGGYHHRSWDGGSEGVYIHRIVISEEKIPHKEWTGFENGDGSIKRKFVEIKIDSWGTIKFKGGIFGSSTVRQSAWEQDRNVLEKALGRAYNNPKLERDSYYRPSSNGESAGPGSL